MKVKVKKSVTYITSQKTTIEQMRKRNPEITNYMWNDLMIIPTK